MPYSVNVYNHDFSFIYQILQENEASQSKGKKLI